MNHSLRTRFIVLQLELEGIQYNTIVNDNTRYTPYYTSTNFIVTTLIKRYFGRGGPNTAILHDKVTKYRNSAPKIAKYRKH